MAQHSDNFNWLNCPGMMKTVLFEVAVRKMLAIEFRVEVRKDGSQHNKTPPCVPQEW